MTEKNLTSRVEEVGYKLYKDNFFSSPNFITCKQELSTAVKLSDRILKKCRETLTVRQWNWNLWHTCYGERCLDSNDLEIQVRQMCIMTNIHKPRAECNFCCGCGRASLLKTTAGTCGTSTVSWRTWKLTQHSFPDVDSNSIKELHHFNILW